MISYSKKRKDEPIPFWFDKTSKKAKIKSWANYSKVGFAVIALCFVVFHLITYVLMKFAYTTGYKILITPLFDADTILLSPIGIFDTTIIVASLSYLFYSIVRIRKRFETYLADEKDSIGTYRDAKNKEVIVAEDSDEETDGIEAVENSRKNMDKSFPGYNEEKVEITVRDMYKDIEKAVHKKNTEIIKDFSLPEFVDFINGEISDLKDNTSHRENIEISNVDIKGPLVDKNGITILAELTVSMLDYVTDKNGKVVAGDRLNPAYFLCIITLALQKNKNTETYDFNDIKVKSINRKICNFQEEETW